MQVGDILLRSRVASDWQICLLETKGISLRDAWQDGRSREMFKRSQPAPEPSQAPSAPQLPGIGVRVYTSNYVLTGRAKTEGPLVGQLNIPNRQILLLQQVQAISLDLNSPLQPASLSQVTVPKERILLIEVLDGEQSFQMEPRQVPVGIYTGRFVIQAELRPPANAPADQYLNLLSGPFFTVSNANIHPVIPTRTLASQQASLLVLNRGQIDFYHTL